METLYSKQSVNKNEVQAELKGSSHPTQEMMKAAERDVRVESLHALNILGTPPEQSYDDMVYLATKLTGSPISLISFIDNKSQWLKAKVGVGFSEINLKDSFCKHVVDYATSIVIEDASRDDAFKNNPFVTGDMHLRFYAGFPLFSKDGVVVGSLCIADHKARKLTASQFDSMVVLARQVSALLDVRKQANQIETQAVTLHEQTEQMDQILSHLNDAVWLRDVSSQRLIYASHGFQRVFEQELHEVLAHSNFFSECVHPEDRERRLLTANTESQGSSEEVYRIVTPMGDIKWIQARSFPIKNDSGRVIRIAGICSDITQRLKQERAVEDNKLKMLHSARLSSLGEMAAGIAHEINNPLAIIHSTAKMLQYTLSTGLVNVGVLNQHIDRIENTASRIGKIIAGLKSFSRDGEQDAFTSYPMQSIVQDTLELCLHRFNNHGVEVRVDMPEVEVGAECRPVQISQILGNLLNNAFDAVNDTDDKWIELKLHEDDLHIKITVTDAGLGIPRDIRDRLMQPFFTTKDPGKGMGLGLSLSRSIAVAHQGILRLVPNTENTTFELVIPKHQKMAA